MPSRHLRTFLPMAIVGSIGVLVFAAFAQVPTYRVAPIFLIPAIWGVFLIRRHVHLHPVHYGLYVLAILIHCVGAFGAYQKKYLGLSFDIYVHFYFAFAGTFIVERLIRMSVSLGWWTVRVVTLLFMMGFGAIHELGEYVSYLVLGEERGMLKPSTSYFFDTQRDLLNNLLGTLTALTLIAIYRNVRTRSTDNANQGV